MNINFTPEDWARIEKTHMDFWNGELGRPLLIIYKKQEKKAPKLPFTPNFWPELPNEMSAEEVVSRYEAQLEADEGWIGDNFPKQWVNFGPGILAGYLGAKVGVAEDTVWFDPNGEKKISEIFPKLDKDNFWYKRVLELTKVAAKRWKGKATIGCTDIGGNMDIIASLRGTQDLLFDCMDEPEEVQRVCKDVTKIWIEVFNELTGIIDANGCGHTNWGPIWTKPGVTTYMLQSDFSYMISPAMFEQFVLPDMYSCCDAIDIPFYHLDGKGELPHLDMLIDIPKLAGIQWQPGDVGIPSADWPEVLTKIKKGGKKCQIYTNAEGAKKVVKEIGGKGFILQVSEHFSRQEAIDFQEMLRKEDCGK
jgi:5-methyltetrahydrofolate--homocysteine methyltransferase